jgi:hypothetical protein
MFLAEVMGMTAKSEMMQAHEAMATVLDAKFANVPEWKAFRAIDRALLALETERPNGATAERPERITRTRPGFAPSYVSLSLQAMEEGKQPIPTRRLMEFIGKRRHLDGDPDRARVSVTSSLSKDRRIKSVPWEGGKAWWFADRAVPKKEMAG